MALAFTATTVPTPVGVQGAYPITTDVAYEGMLADSNPSASVVRSAINETGDALPFGAMVHRRNAGGSAFNSVKLASDAARLQGLTIASFIREGVAAGNGSYVGASPANPTNIAPDGRQGYPNLTTANILRRGQIWVYTTEAVAIGDPVRFWDTDYSGTVDGAFVGRFCSTASGARTVLVDTGMEWLSETAGPGLAILDVNFPSVIVTADS